MPVKKCARSESGFTMIEVIAVLLIVGITGAVIILRTTSTSEAAVAAQVAKIETQLRYAQTNAMNSDNVWGINFSGSTYALFRNGNTSDKVILPGEDDPDVTLPDGASLTRTVSFDKWGRPSTVADGTPTDGDIEFSIAGYSIKIYKNTGYIP